MRHHRIVVDDDNDPAPEKISASATNPEPAAPEPLVWYSEVIVCPQLAGRLPNSFAGFEYIYTYIYIYATKMSKLGLFLVLFPFDYLKDAVISDTIKHLKEPTYFNEFLRFIASWFYLACWEGILIRHSWWSAENPQCLVARCFYWMNTWVTIGLIQYFQHHDT